MELLDSSVRRTRFVYSCPLLDTMTAGDSKSRPPDITELLKDYTAGRRDVLDRVVALVYDELRRMARARMSRERPDHTLQATALVHEAFERLVQQRVSFRNRAHFFGIAAKCMRRILMDHRRRKESVKRPPQGGAVELDAAVVVDDRFEEAFAVDEALEKLARLDERQAAIAELRYFGGLTSEEVGEVLGISRATVTREWEVAKMWLYKALKGLT